MSIGGSEHLLVQQAVAAIKHVCERDNIPERIRKAMQFRIDTHYDNSSMAFIVRIAWRDPDGGGLVRNMQCRFDDMALKNKHNGAQEELMHAIDSINLRGELFFFKLHKHFPNRIEKVRCEQSGRVHVMFKNGRELSVDEQNLDSVEFLATCGMVYDL